MENDKNYQFSIWVKKRNKNMYEFLEIYKSYRAFSSLCFIRVMIVPPRDFSQFNKKWETQLSEIYFNRSHIVWPEQIRNDRIDHIMNKTKTFFCLIIWLVDVFRENVSKLTDHKQESPIVPMTAVQKFSITKRLQ